MDNDPVTRRIIEGLAFHKAEKYQEAERCYMSALTRRPHDPGLLHLIGALAGDVGRSDLAISYLVQAAQLEPTNSAINSNLGEQYRRLERFPEAITALSRAVAIKPDCFPSLFNLGRAERAVGDFSSAIIHFAAAMAVDPANSAARLQLGQTLVQAGKLEQARETLQELTRLEPGNADGWASLALAQRRLGNRTDAVGASSRAVELRPHLPGFWADHSLYLNEAGRLDEALAAADRAVSLAPADSEFIRQRAAVLGNLGLLDECVTELRRALAVRPDNAEVHLDLANALLLQGDWLPAWGHYEWRWKSTRFPRRSVNLTQWDGSPLEGRSVLIHAEQGFGDMIQFVRYLPEIGRRGGTGMLVVDEIVFDLFDGLGGVPAVRPADLAGKFDLHLPLASFPLVCRTTPETIPRGLPYLSADPVQSETWNARLGPKGSRFRVGIAWGGRPTHANDHNRSVRLDRFAPLAAVDGVDFFSLQKGPPAAQAKSPPAGMALIDHADHLNTFADTAALLTQLDLVIAIDTSVVHLAGAMGIPAWVLLPFVPDWRWGRTGDTSAWYPSLRLFRQPEIGDWETVFETVAVELAKTRSKRPSE